MIKTKGKNDKERRQWQSGWRGRSDSAWRKLARKLKRANTKDPKKSDKEQEVQRTSRRRKT